MIITTIYIILIFLNIKIIKIKKINNKEVKINEKVISNVYIGPTEPITITNQMGKQKVKSTPSTNDIKHDLLDLISNNVDDKEKQNQLFALIFDKVKGYIK